MKPLRKLVYACAGLTLFVWFMGAIAIVAHSETLGNLTFLTAGLALAGWMAALIWAMSEDFE